MYKNNCLVFILCAFTILFISCANNGSPKGVISEIKEFGLSNSGSFIVDITFDETSKHLKRYTKIARKNKTILAISVRSDGLYPEYNLICGYLGNGYYDDNGKIGCRFEITNLDDMLFDGQDFSGYGNIIRKATSTKNEVIPPENLDKKEYGSAYIAGINISRIEIHLECDTSISKMFSYDVKYEVNEKDSGIKDTSAFTKITNGFASIHPVTNNGNFTAKKTNPRLFKKKQAEAIKAAHQYINSIMKDPEATTFTNESIIATRSITSQSNGLNYDYFIVKSFVRSTNSFGAFVTQWALAEVAITDDMGWHSRTYGNGICMFDLEPNQDNLDIFKAILGW